MMTALWFGLCIMLAWTIEAMSGFGSIVIALSLGALLLPIESMLPVLVTLNVLTSAWLMWQHRAHIDGPLLLRTILPGMLPATLLGIFLRDALPGPVLKTAFALLILWFALKELWAMRRQKEAVPHSVWQTQALVGAAGITHGLFASGGPLLVYALAGRQLGKASFRATLISLWLMLNGVLCGIFLLQGRVTAHLPEVAGYLPVVASSVWLGNHLHHRIDEAKFRVLIFWLLAVVGLALLFSQMLIIWR